LLGSAFKLALITPDIGYEIMSTMLRGHGQRASTLSMTYEEVIGHMSASDVDYVTRGAIIALANPQLAPDRRAEVRNACNGLVKVAKLTLAAGGDAKLAMGPGVGDVSPKLSAAEALTLRTLRRIGRET